MCDKAWVYTNGEIRRCPNEATHEAPSLKCPGETRFWCPTHARVIDRIGMRDFGRKFCVPL